MADKKISQLSNASTPLAGTEVLPIVQSSATVKVATDDLTVKNIRSNVTTGILQIAGPGAAATRTMTVPDANFTVARTDAAQTFSGDQTVSGVVAGTRFTSATSSFVANPSTAVFGFYSGGGTPQTYIQMPLNGSIAFWGPTTAERARLDSNGNFSLNAGNLGIGTAGKGIDFSANTHAAGMTSELLNWYEEGTATAVLTDGTNNATLAAGSGMVYTRIGRVVMVQGYIEVSNIGSVSGALRLAGLPFNVNISARSALSVGQAGGLAITAGQSVTGFGQANTNYIRLYVWTATTGATDMTNTQLSTGGFISFSFNYVVA